MTLDDRVNTESRVQLWDERTGLAMGVCLGDPWPVGGRNVKWSSAQSMEHPNRRHRLLRFTLAWRRLGRPRTACGCRGTRPSISCRLARRHGPDGLGVPAWEELGS